MCFTGGFALAMMVDPSVAAPVVAQPSAPFAIGKKRGADLNLSPGDLDAVRRRAAATEPLESAESAGILSPSLETPLDAAEIAETRQIVHAAMEKLPPDQRETLEMAYFKGLSQSEIAEATGQPLGTVKTRCRLGLQKLREALSVLREDGA